MKKIILILILALSLVAIFLVIRQALKFINTIEDINRLTINTQTPYRLKTSSIIMKNIKSLDNDTVTFKGVKILNFWATWCKPCITEQPSLEDLQRKYPSIQVIQISFDSLNKQVKLIKNAGWNLPAYFIEDSTIFGIPKFLPKTYIIKNDTVYAEIYGAKDWKKLTNTRILDSILLK